MDIIITSGRTSVYLNSLNENFFKYSQYWQKVGYEILHGCRISYTGVYKILHPCIILYISRNSYIEYGKKLALGNAAEAFRII